VSQPERPAIAMDRLPARLTGQWVHGKKYYFCRYLDIMTRAVANKWQGKLSYIDLFSGPGRSVIRDTREEVEGSPILSLNYGFASYVFVDIPEVLDSLKKRLAGHPKFPRISFVEGDCNAVIDSVRAKSPADHLTLAFIDPTGLQIQFRTIRRLVQNRKMDLLMTIQFGMGIKMNLHQYIRTEGRMLTAFLGNAGWRQDIEAGGSASQAGRHILNRYMSELKAIGYRTVQNREINIRNDQNLLLYFIVLASRHSLGAKFWREATQIEWTGQRLLHLPADE
jgi:three-Cys-motif partner protein